MNAHWLVPERERLRLTVRGIVQGVGFRPFVYGLALRYRLAGHVGNNGEGVFIEIEGESAALARFQAALTAEAPPLAHISRVDAEALAPCGGSEFVILDSQQGGQVHAHIPADVAVCDECLRELYDPANRRYRYPFINCTHCGPRFTIIRGIPYDRASTTMAVFPMCPACTAEYHDPRSRRFHAQPISCPDCGPQLWYQPVGGAVVRGTEEALTAARLALRAGQIVAVKGLGGFHLACDATSDRALQTLRSRKGRAAKPFAVMVRDLATAHQCAEISAGEAAALSSFQRPIVLLRKRGGVSALAAPDNPWIGLMLPYTPLHYLLLDRLPFPLVMTSGNLSGEPIATGNDEALERLMPLVDAFLLHDRPIYTPCDDSVLRVYAGVELPVRRSRGYAPLPITVGGESALAVGGELKNSFCLIHNGCAVLSQHIGDMENIETLAAFEKAQAHLRALYQAQPQAVVCDLHPDYLTSRWAERHAAQTGLPLIRVQHHHAHVASLMAEHGLEADQPIIGVVLDGTGYGTDGGVWGGEVLVADYGGFRRAAHLKAVPLPGGDAAVKRPYRMALAHLWAAGVAWADDLPPVAACSPAERAVLARQFETGFGTAPTTSVGRLFDAVASLIDIRQCVTYEAQAAVELEGAASQAADRRMYRFDVSPDVDGKLIIDPAPLIRDLVLELRAGVSVSAVAAGFHAAMAAALLTVCEGLRAAGQGNVVGLTGGVFQNLRLLDEMVGRLRERGFSVLIHRIVPCNDGGLALGQAVIGAHRLRAGKN